MNQWPTTQDSLLQNLADPASHDAWFDFARLYEPVVYRFSRKRGLQHADAVEVTQRVMLSVLRSAPGWQNSQPPNHFRSWLKSVATNTLINLTVRESKHRAGESGRVIEQPTDEQSAWQTEEKRSILREALSRIRSEFSADSWEAFERTLLQRESVDAVAADLKKSAGAIYAARARIMKRLQRESKILEARHE